MENTKKQVSIEHVVTEVLHGFKAMNYCEGYLEKLQYVLQTANEYAVCIGQQYYTEDFTEKFRSYYYDGRKANHRSDAERAINAIYDYANYGKLLRRTKPSPTPWRGPLADSLSLYYSSYREQGWSESSLTQTKRSLYQFYLYLVDNGMHAFAEVDDKMICDFIGMRYLNSSAKHQKRTLQDIRKFLEYVHANIYPVKVFNHIFPCIRVFDDSEEIQHVFTKDEVQRLLLTVDRGGPLGKRDYAILMLASRYGLRASDIRNLKFSDIDWQEDKLTFIQSKTGTPLCLPLFDDVGWAIIDYIDNGRPQSSCQFVFVIHNAPYDRFIGSMVHIVEKYLRLAKISVGPGKKPGIHSFRRYVASELLRGGIQIPVIKEILGHKTIQTTARYQSIDLNQLALCALEVPYAKN